MYICLIICADSSNVYQPQKTLPFSSPPALPSSSSSSSSSSRGAAEEAQLSPPHLAALSCPARVNEKDVALPESARGAPPWPRASRAPEPSHCWHLYKVEFVEFACGGQVDPLFRLPGLGGTIRGFAAASTGRAAVVVLDGRASGFVCA